MAHSFASTRARRTRARGDRRTSDDDGTHVDSALGGRARDARATSLASTLDVIERARERSNASCETSRRGRASAEASEIEATGVERSRARQAIARARDDLRAESVERVWDDDRDVDARGDRARARGERETRASAREHWGDAREDARQASSSAVGAHARPADSAGDSNTAQVSSERARAEPGDSTEAQRVTTTSRGEGEVGMNDSGDHGPGHSEEVEGGGGAKAQGSLLAGEGTHLGGGQGGEVESREVVEPKSTPWDAQEPWDVPREQLIDACLALKARADALKGLERYEKAERAYGHALRFIDQIEMFGSADDFSERNATLKNDCLLEASACALRRADPVRAGELASRALARDPTAAQALKARALAAAAEGDFDAAIRDLDKALESNPNDSTLVAELRDVKQRRDIALRMPRRSGIASSYIGAPGGVSWGTMPMAMGGTTSSAQGGQLFSYPNAGYVASGGLGLTDEVLGETDGVIGAGTSSAAYGGAVPYSPFSRVGDSGAMDALAMLDGTHLRRDDSPSRATGIESRMDEPATFNRMGETPSVSLGMTLSIQKGAQSDALQLGDESEEDGEEVCGKPGTRAG